MIGKIVSYDRKNCLIRQFFVSYRKVFKLYICLIISSYFGLLQCLFCLYLKHLDAFSLGAATKENKIETKYHRKKRKKKELQENNVASKTMKRTEFQVC
ncbi:hypothetical protein GCWU000325_02406 [Alloprevotella tannerae ATCC 51259]|uniref:Uncharacterized protein n=1 Tax=Alloprevotella tannerae ATCC 51259 TaxID=626522 RepID=C9LJJ3_9BACT|nr:hypothetical protein GCWU000325_02406 [Alloprevotella tannerae ATCC 51259]